jgi:hypothetical protein
MHLRTQIRIRKVMLTVVGTLFASQLARASDDHSATSFMGRVKVAQKVLLARAGVAKTPLVAPPPDSWANSNGAWGNQDGSGWANAWDNNGNGAWGNAWDNDGGWANAWANG